MATTAKTKTTATATTGKKTVKLVQTGSLTGIEQVMKATLAGLGLGKTRSTSELVDTPSVRGMMRKVRHLITVEGETK